MKKQKDLLMNNTTTLLLKHQNRMDMIAKVGGMNSAITAINRYHSTMDFYSKFDKLNNIVKQTSGIYAMLEQNHIFSQKYMNTLATLQRFATMQDNMYKTFSTYENIQKMIVQTNGISTIQHIIDSQSRLYSMIEKFSYEPDNKNDISVDNIIETIEEENFEEQTNVIEKETSESLKTYLQKNHLAILALVVSIVFGVITIQNNKNTELQQDRVISLLERNVAIQEQQQISQEEQCKLLRENLELLKELKAIKNSNTPKIK